MLQPVRLDFSWRVREKYLKLSREPTVVVVVVVVIVVSWRKVKQRTRVTDLLLFISKDSTSGESLKNR